jgi:GGDEF domain-containing protein
MSCACAPATAAAPGVRTNWRSRCASSPPGGRPWWFRLLLSSLLAAMVYALVRLRTRHLRLRQIELKRWCASARPSWSAALALQRESAALEESSLTDPLTGLRNRRFLPSTSRPMPPWRCASTRVTCKYGGSCATMPADILPLRHRSFQAGQRPLWPCGGRCGDRANARSPAAAFPRHRLPGSLGWRRIPRRRARDAAHARGRTRRAGAGGGGRSAFRTGRWRLLSKTCSIGFCCFPLSTQHAARSGLGAVVNIADAALYAVKSAGRNGWLGALSAGGESAEALLPGRAGLLAEWTRSGQSRWPASASRGCSGQEARSGAVAGRNPGRSGGAAGRGAQLHNPAACRSIARSIRKRRFARTCCRRC